MRTNYIIIAKGDTIIINSALLILNLPIIFGIAKNDRHQPVTIVPIPESVNISSIIGCGIVPFNM